jgi:hypothetical protein
MRNITDLCIQLASMSGTHPVSLTFVPAHHGIEIRVEQKYSPHRAVRRQRFVSINELASAKDGLDVAGLVCAVLLQDVAREDRAGAYQLTRDMIERAKRAGLLTEVVSTYSDLRAAGELSEDAAAHALREWDIAQNTSLQPTN